LSDISGNIYIADSDNHRIKKVDATTGTITTVAGTGSAGDSGDDGPAVSARMNKPRGLWVDDSGNILIADFDNHRIKKVDNSTGIITTVAGDGTGSFSGDNGPATSASLKKPHGVCVYESPAPATLHIADAYNYETRKVDMSTRMITKVAGTWWRGYNGDNIPAVTAMLNYTFGVHVDASRNVYIADTYNHRIRKVDATTGIITTVAGTGSKGSSGDGGPAISARLRYPYGVYVDASGNIFIADTLNYRIRKVDATTGIITTVAGDGAAKFSGDGGPATSASIRKSYDVAVDSAGNIFIADSHNHAIRKVDAATGIITTVAGKGAQAGSSGDDGPATSANLNQPYGVFVDAEKNIYIADSKNDRIRKVDATTGIITTVAGTGTGGDSGDGGPATLARLDFPEGVWVDRAGNIYIADTFNDRIKKVDATTGIITTVAGTGSYGYNGNDIPATDALLNAPTDISLHEPSSLEKLPEVYLPSS
jgi:sugar lactone lactonase YvrE